MAIRVNNISLNIDESQELLKKKVSKALKIKEEDIIELKIIKESIDARKKDNIKFNYCVDIKCNGEKSVLKKAKCKDAKIEEPEFEENTVHGTKKLNSRPVVIGFGPAGIFSALTLAREGYKPIVLSVEKMWIIEQRLWKVFGKVRVTLI